MLIDPQESESAVSRFGLGTLPLNASELTISVWGYKGYMVGSEW